MCDCPCHHVIQPGLIPCPTCPENGTMATREDSVLITGTGRAGTSFLAGVLQQAGVDVQLTPFDDAIRAGRETVLPVPEPAPVLIKSPALAIQLDALLDSGTFTSEHLSVVCPVRRRQDAARSRAEAGLDYWCTLGLTEDQVVGQLVETCVLRDVELVMLAYPRLVEDAGYAEKKLRDVLDRLDVPHHRFLEAHHHLAWR